jgi:hypothetical protein
MSTLRELQAKVFDKINPAVSFSVTRYVMAIGFFVAFDRRQRGRQPGGVAGFIGHAQPSRRRHRAVRSDL